jgi:hypothetical protein
MGNEAVSTVLEGAGRKRVHGAMKKGGPEPERQRTKSQ